MVQPVSPPFDVRARTRHVTTDAFAAAYRALYPAKSRITDPITFAAVWLDNYAADPESHVSVEGDSRLLTAALFKALEIPVPKTDEMALFVLTNPDMEKRPSQLVYVKGENEDGVNVDVIVRAVSREHAEIAWREYFDGYDLPSHPQSIVAIPAAGPLGAISWELLNGDPEEEAHGEDESQNPNV